MFFCLSPHKHSASGLEQSLEDCRTIDLKSDRSKEQSSRYKQLARIRCPSKVFFFFTHRLYRLLFFYKQYNFVAGGYSPILLHKL